MSHRNQKTYFALLIALLISMAGAVHAQNTNLAIKPITWDVVGLDSNKPLTSGPDSFMVGARVTNIGTNVAENVVTSYVWESTNSFITLNGPTILEFGDIQPGQSIDAYYNVKVTRNANAYDTARRYRIHAVADNAGQISTPAGRQLYIEALIRQNRNSVLSLTGPTTVYVGGIYTYDLASKTATNGYEQLVTFVDFPNILFQILQVHQTYTAPPNATNDTTYADACGWDPDPSSPTYLDCIGPENFTGGKAGGTVTTRYVIRAVSAGDATVNTLIYDKSGASYHYNSDFGAAIGSIAISVEDPAAILTGTVFEDLGNTGEPNPGDPPFAGITVTLIGAGPDGIFGTADDEVIATTTTDVNGEYTFLEAIPGQYQVQVDEAAIGSDYIGTSGPNPRTVTLVQNQTTEAQFGFIIPGLTVNKSSDVVGLVTPGQTINYTITATNVAPTTLFNFSLADVLPDYTTLVPGFTEVTYPALISGTFIDPVTSVAYNGSTGTQAWANNWQEVSDDGNPANGNVRIEQDLGEFRIRVNRNGRAIWRTANLSAYDTASLSFRFRMDGMGASDSMVVEASSTGNANYTILETITGTNHATYQDRTYNLTPHISANTTIRFRYIGGGGNNVPPFFFDQVQISASGSQVTTLPATLPNILSGINLGAGDTVTATFRVTVDDPLPTFATSIVNTASATADDIADYEGSAIDPVGGNISGSIFNDINGNGLLDGGEPGLEGISVTLTDQFGNSQTVTTNASGVYTAFVASGDVTVSVDPNDPNLPTGAVLTTDNADQVVDVGAATTTTADDVGFQQQGELSGIIFLDINGNGIQDDGEPGLEDITVTITDQFGNVQTVLTDGEGSYLFSVATGDVTIEVDTNDPELPGGAVLTTGGNNTQIVNVDAGEETEASAIGFQARQPVMTLTQIADTATSGVVDAKEAYSYTLVFENTADDNGFNEARNLVFTVVLPSATSYGDQIVFLNLLFGTGYSGTFSRTDDVVTITLNEVVQPGESGELTLFVRAIDPLPDNVSVVNVATLNYQDMNNEDMEPVVSANSLDVGILLVELESFTVNYRSSDGRLVIEWVTSAEFGAAGFDLYRVDPLEGTKSMVPLNPSMIPAEGSPISGGVYTFVDPVPYSSGETRGYLLVETEMSGNTINYGTAWFPHPIGAATGVLDWMEF
ncbi:MAG: DUF11 domain-containing protein [Candidatus Sumerlaeia bacterium]|nr:DUF11 domain-containing protein [Candidatus Sumerlaeia bacterium]